MAKNWIQGMHMKKGALHKELKVPANKPIPEAKLKAAEKSRNPLESKRANLAKTLGSFKKK